MNHSRKNLCIVVIALAAIVALAAPNSQASGQRLVAQLHEPFIVNGEVHPAGTLAVRDLGRYSPVVTLNQIEVDGLPVGYVMAETTTSAPASADELVFVRDSMGYLVLHAFAWSGEAPRELRPVPMTAAPLRASTGADVEAGQSALR
jgi:hypothetical protein